ncbi:uncharacterized protein LOC132729130 [Ruditapes philippinarum]|uniref:uncharacterized protein LOC132729130 n=1 Tax=Ruditapes philippinarum TaxID=129788 RepID=UPI00295B97EE|nr:uncharacterized protein LOC132729130 [Ruditapes philippinarum]
MLRAGDVAFVLGGVLVLVWAFVGVAGVCRMSPKDLVTLQDLEEKVDGMDWIQIYVFEDRSNQNYGKCNVRWNLPPDSDGFIRRQLICYNFNYEACEDFERALKRSVDECGRAQENAEICEHLSYCASSWANQIKAENAGTMVEADRLTLPPNFLQKWGRITEVTSTEML